MKKSNYKKNIIEKYSWITIIFLVVLLAIIINSQRVYAEWKEPSLPPPVEQFYAPLTTTGEPQTKEGYLLLDPETYHPSQGDSLGFSVDKPLVVMGEGALFSTPYVYSDKLIIDTDTLYVDSLVIPNWVGIGAVIQQSTERLLIDGTVQIGNDTTPINSRAVSSYSNNNYGIYSNASVNGSAGVYGLRTENNGWAVYGESESNNGIRGQSTSGAGIYAVTNSSTFGAVYGSNDSSGFAGYFDGNLGSVSDMVARRFLPTGLQLSLIPFTSGQKIEAYEFGVWSGLRQSADLVFDGSYIWSLATADDNGNSLFKYRASDGVFINSYDIGYSSTVFGLIYDSQYLWFVFDSGLLAKFDPEDGTTVTYDIGLSAGYPSKSLAISEENGSYYIWAYKNDVVITNEAIVKVDIADGIVVDTYIVDTLFDVNVDELNGIVYDGDYIWVSAESGYLAGAWAEDPNDSDHPIRIFDTLVASEFNCVPHGVEFDGEYIWCMTGLGANQTLIRIWADNPADSQHPPENVGEGMTEDLDAVKEGVFDGTYLWAIDWDENYLYRFLMADVSQYKVFDLSFQADEMIFDGTYLWLAEVSGSRLHKYFSGTGMGNTNLSSIVNLDLVDSQAGNINISDSSEVGTDIVVGTDVDISDNDWGGICQDGTTYCTSSTDCTSLPGIAACYGDTVLVVGGIASCEEGEFMGGVELDAGSEIINIYCWKL